MKAYVLSCFFIIIKKCQALPSSLDSLNRPSQPDFSYSDLANVGREGNFNLLPDVLYLDNSYLLPTESTNVARARNFENIDLLKSENPKILNSGKFSLLQRNSAYPLYNSNNTIPSFNENQNHWNPENADLKTSWKPYNPDETRLTNLEQRLNVGHVPTLTNEEYSRNLNSGKSSQLQQNTAYHLYDASSPKVNENTIPSYNGNQNHWNPENADLKTSWKPYKSDETRLTNLEQRLNAGYVPTLTNEEYSNNLNSENQNLPNLGNSKLLNSKNVPLGPAGIPNGSQIMNDTENRFGFGAGIGAGAGFSIGASIGASIGGHIGGGLRGYGYGGGHGGFGHPGFYG